MNYINDKNVQKLLMGYYLSIRELSINYLKNSLRGEMHFSKEQLLGAIKYYIEKLKSIDQSKPFDFYFNNEYVEGLATYVANHGMLNMGYYKINDIVEKFTSDENILAMIYRTGALGGFFILKEFDNFLQFPLDESGQLKYGIWEKILLNVKSEEAKESTLAYIDGLIDEESLESEMALMKEYSE